jgi:2,3-bisphosphoglycerate-dependent phosphoglycerate mutase
MKKSLRLFVLTHCESCYNKRGIFTGRVDSVLTPNGHKHAKKLADKLKDRKIDVAYVSPLTRAKQTLKHILKYHPRTEVFVDDRITERDYGRLSKKSKAKYKQEHPDLYPIYHRAYDVPPPGGESMKQVEKRISPFIEDVLRLMKKEKVNVLVISHGNAIRPIRRYFERLTTDQMMKLEHQQHKIFEYQIDV